MRRRLSPLVAAAVLLAALAIEAGAAQTLFDVTRYGARGDGRADDTHAVRSAVAALGAAGGGRLLFPGSRQQPRHYLTAPFNLSSNTRVEIQAGATILGSQNGSQYPLLKADRILPGCKGGRR
jgi:polygalacturonase